MKKYRFKIRGNEYDVEIKDFDNTTAEIEVNGTTYTVELENVKSQLKTKTPKLVRSSVPTPTHKESTIQKNEGSSVKSPLPGTIIKILVKEGDTVKLGDKLLTMEAMKMENNVLAEVDGVVAKIHVKEAETVLQNDTLLTIS